MKGSNQCETGIIVRKRWNNVRKNISIMQGNTAGCYGCVLHTYSRHNKLFFCVLAKNGLLVQSFKQRVCVNKVTQIRLMSVLILSEAFYNTDSWSFSTGWRKLVPIHLPDLFTSDCKLNSCPLSIPQNDLTKIRMCAHANCQQLPMRLTGVS